MKGRNAVIILMVSLAVFLIVTHALTQEATFLPEASRSKPVFNTTKEKELGEEKTQEEQRMQYNKVQLILSAPLPFLLPES